MATADVILRGVVPILVTPFDDEGAIDEASLRNEVDYAIDAGVHGLGIALGSEVYKLTEAERDRVTAIVVDQAKDRLPVVVNTGAAATDLAIHYSRRAEALGAAGLMCSPPGSGFSGPEIREYFAGISGAVGIPIVLQDTAATPVGAALIREIGETCERVRYAKVESVPPAVLVGRAVAAVGETMHVFGGAGGGQFIEELRRGSIGTMPFPSTARAFVTVWDRWHAGDVDGAWAVFDAEIAPLLRISIGSLGGAHHIHKEALRRQGVIRTAFVRSPADPLDAITAAELAEVCDCFGWTAST
ncbi:MAG: dihydrodipicolinate synthase family protein [Thermomicrobiales bacterium]